VTRHPTLPAYRLARTVSPGKNPEMVALYRRSPNPSRCPPETPGVCPSLGSGIKSSRDLRGTGTIFLPIPSIRIPGIKIFHYSGSLNFASKQYFREEVYKIAELIPQIEVKKRLQTACNGTAAEEIKKVNNV